MPTEQERPGMFARPTRKLGSAYTDEHVKQTTTSRHERLPSIFTHGSDGVLTTHGAYLRPPTMQDASRKRIPDSHSAAAASIRGDHPEPLRSHPPMPPEQSPLSATKRARTQRTADASQYVNMNGPLSLSCIAASTRRPVLRSTRPDSMVADVVSSDGHILEEISNWKSDFKSHVDFSLPRDHRSLPVPQHEEAPADGNSSRYSRFHGSSAFDFRESAKYVARPLEQPEQTSHISRTTREVYQAHSPSYTGEEIKKECSHSRGTESGSQAQHQSAPRRLSLHLPTGPGLHEAIFGPSAEQVDSTAELGDRMSVATAATEDSLEDYVKYKAWVRRE
jgi:hypothetical protein